MSEEEGGEVKAYQINATYSRKGKRRDEGGRGVCAYRMNLQRV